MTHIHFERSNQFGFSLNYLHSKKQNQTNPNKQNLFWLYKFVRFNL